MSSLAKSAGGSPGVTSVIGLSAMTSSGVLLVCLPSAASGVGLSAVTSSSLLVRLLCLPLTGFFDCFSRSFASFSGALCSLSSF